MPDQQCPNCRAQHDVSIFVTGQRVRCSKCGIRFEVVRSDASVITSGKKPEDASREESSEGGSAPEEPLYPLPDAGVPDRAPEGVRSSASPQEPAGDEREAEAGEAGRASDGPPDPTERSSAAGPRPTPAGTPPDASRAVAIAEDATAISQGISIPGFEVLHVLGRGGMGDVYLARQASLNREVAVKVLAKHLAEDPDFVRRFEKEAQALATLSHPNVVSIIDRGSHGGVLYFVMEYVDGHSLRDVLRGGPMEESQAVKVVTQVCAAIDYAHGRGVIHRDLKPENILIDVQGHVKVADFGLAGIIGGDERIHFTRTDVAMGTFNYMAPEQRRNAREVDARADLFSLGVVLYELLTGEVPVGRFQLPSKVKPELDPKIDDIVERALQTNPGERYQRASAIHDDLRELVGTSSLTVAPAPARRWEKSGEKSATGSGTSEESEGGSRISDIARSADSVVDRASRSIFKLARLGLAVVALALVGAVVLGSFKLIGWIWDGEQPTEMDRLAREKLPRNDEPRLRPGPRRPQPPESPLLVPLKFREDGLDGFAHRAIDFTDDTAGEVEWYTHRGWWENREGVLVHDVFMAGHGVVDDRLIPRAFVGGERYFFEGYRIELTLTIDDTPPVRGRRAGELRAELNEISEGAFPQASVYLYRNMRHYLELAVLVGDDGGYEVIWSLDDEGREGSFVGVSDAEPVLGRPVRVALWVSGQEVHAEIDGAHAGSAPLGELTEENWGKAGVGCHLAVCTFEEVVVKGYTRPPPGRVDSSDGATVPSAGN